MLGRSGGTARTCIRGSSRPPPGATPGSAVASSPGMCRTTIRERSCGGLSLTAQTVLHSSSTPRTGWCLGTRKLSTVCERQLPQPLVLGVLRCGKRCRDTDSRDRRGSACFWMRSWACYGYSLQVDEECTSISTSLVRKTKPLEHPEKIQLCQRPDGAGDAGDALFHDSHKRSSTNFPSFYRVQATDNMCYGAISTSATDSVLFLSSLGLPVLTQFPKVGTLVTSRKGDGHRSRQMVSRGTSKCLIVAETDAPRTR